LNAEDGATSIEYALIAGIVAVGIVASLTLVRNELQASFSGVATNFQAINN
jgi:Flp pilus assembly pilin Flp